MAVIDYIFIALCAVMLVVGILKGFLKLLFGFLGIILIPIGTAYLSAYPQQWMASLITDQALLTIAALVVTFITLSLIYGMITALIVKLIHKATGLRAVDRIVGAVMSVAIIYLVFAVFESMITNTSEQFLPLIKKLVGDQFTQSKIMPTLYSNNFFGDYIVDIIKDRLAQMAQ